MTESNEYFLRINLHKTMKDQDHKDRKENNRFSSLKNIKKTLIF